MKELKKVIKENKTEFLTMQMEMFMKEIEKVVKEKEKEFYLQIGRFMKVSLISFPSELKQTDDNELSERVKTSFCSRRFHSLIVLSPEPLAINCPSGLKQTYLTDPEWHERVKTSFCLHKI